MKISFKIYKLNLKFFKVDLTTVDFLMKYILANITAVNNAPQTVPNAKRATPNLKIKAKIGDKTKFITFPIIL